MWPEDVIKDYRRQEFEVDCVDMVLTQSVSENPVTFRGKGHIRQRPDNELEFKIYVIEVRGTNADDDLHTQLSGQPGQFFPEAAYFNLEAIDRDGRTWSAQRLLPDRYWPNTPDSMPVATGRVWNGLVSISEADHKRYSMELYFFTDVRMPYLHGTKSVIDGRESWRRDQVKLSAAGCDFVIRESEGGFVVEVTSQAPFLPYFANRIHEALQYILAHPVFWQIQIIWTPTSEHFEFADRREFTEQPHMRPPMTFTAKDYHKNVWRLFSLYLEYVVRSSPDQGWNPCAYYIHLTREASGGAREAHATALGVAVEALANYLPSYESGTTAEQKQKIIDALISHLGTLPDAADFEGRIKGLLKSLHNPRSQDRLIPLIASGHADRAHVRAWRDLRNKRVHPINDKFKNISTEDHQYEANLIYQTTVLLYHITFALIGYEGPYSDYSTISWPSKNYPLLTEEAAKPA